VWYSKVAEDDRRLLAAARDAARDLAAAMGDRTGDLRLAWDHARRLTDML